MGEDHEQKVQDPDDVPPEEDTDQSADPVPFFKTGDDTQNKRSDGDDRQDEGHDPRKTEIVLARILCHVTFLL